ncbi:MAG TPA: CPBP family glutamic-type intramembrane protease [Bacillota bacterium]|nr:CPBP family glutamic-type intramembrane protease [Bacillota bacterium]
MKKRLIIAGYVILYLGIMFIFSRITQTLWFGLTPPKIANHNYLLFVFGAFLLTLISYGVIFKLRKKNLIKTCNFAKLSVKNFGMSLTVGLLFGVFTSSLCNTSYIIKNIPGFEQYVMNQLHGMSTFAAVLVVIAFIFASEEVIFRGVIFNEIRNGASLYASVLIATALYGVINSITEGVAIAIFALIAALFYNLAYVYMQSLWASIIIQISSIYLMLVFIKTGLWIWLRHLGDGVLLPVIIIIPLLVIIVFYFMRRDYQKITATGKTSVPA